MKFVISALFVALLVLIFGFRIKNTDKNVSHVEVVTTSLKSAKPVKDSIQIVKESEALKFVKYAKTLMGTPYLYGSADPEKGLDCSGFINAVSNHFGIKVPRSSVEFTNMGSSVDINSAKPGDLILFTGTDPGKKVVGHIGIITDNQNGDVGFIHSSSGKANGVTISELAGYYETRFVKVIRIFTDASEEIV
jgi:cell wall-associated NlpC family hydrolase